MTRHCGTKQVLKALENSKVERVFLAVDADEPLKAKIIDACNKKSVSVEYIDSMTQLGKMCNISVGAATAVDISE